MDEEAKKMIPRGSLYRIVRPIVKSKECGLTPEYVAALNKYVSKLVADITFDTCEQTLARGKKRITVEDLKAVGDKRGFLVE